MAQLIIEEIEVTMVFREQEAEETETGEVVTRNRGEVEVHTGHPLIRFAIIAMRKVIAKSIVPNIWRRGCVRTHVLRAGNQTIG